MYFTLLLKQAFLTGGTKHQSRGYERRRQNNGCFKLFSKNLFAMFFEIRKHFPKPFLTSAFLNDFFVIRKSYCDVINSFLFVPTELILH